MNTFDNNYISKLRKSPTMVYKTIIGLLSSGILINFISDFSLLSTIYLASLLILSLYFLKIIKLKI